MIKRLYDRPPSFTDLLPWVEYNPESRTFLLEDGISLGALFELTPAGTEARTPEFMTQLRDAIQTALTDAIPEEDDAPWVLQVYVQDEPSLQGFQKEIAANTTACAFDNVELNAGDARLDAVLTHNGQRHGVYQVMVKKKTDAGP